MTATVGAFGKRSQRRLASCAESTALRELLFPSDLSPFSDGAFAHARLLTEQFRARMVLYHAIEVDGVGDLAEPPQPAAELWRRVETAAYRHLLHGASTSSVRSDIRVERTTSVPDAVVAFLKAQRPDLTVMATHGRGAIAHFMLGSIAERVLREARTPLLCVRAREHGAALPYRRI